MEDRRGWRKSLIRKMLGNDDNNRDRSHLAIWRVVRERPESQTSVFGHQVMTQDSCPTLEGGFLIVKMVPVVFSVTGQCGKY